jgi:hypothetical protein
VYLADALVHTFSGKGLVPDAVAASSEFLLAVAAGAGATVILATLLGLPVSTTHALTGALTGAGLAAVGPQLNLSHLGSGFFAPLVFGPVVALQPGTGQIIQAIAFGVMVGLKDPIYKDTSHSWNMGFGVSLEPSSTTLGDGLVANQPVPVGATIRTQTRSLVGFTALLSYGW